MSAQPWVDLREVVVRTLGELVEEGVNLLVVISDSSSTSRIAPFRERYPQRVVDVGIAEQDLVGVAVGLSLAGYVAVTANAAPFLVARANEQVKNDVCYSDANVKLLGINAGVAYGPLGATHHAIDDLSIMQGFGNILVLAPADPVEAGQMLRFAVKHPGPVYVRLDSAKYPVLHTRDYCFAPGAVDVLKRGSDLTIAAVGSTVHEAYFAARELRKSGIEAEVLNVSSFRPLDPGRILESVRKTGAVLTVEEHSLHGGLGSVVARVVAEAGIGVPLRCLGIPLGSFAVAGPRAELQAYYGIDQRGIERSARDLCSMRARRVRKGA